MVLGIGEGAEVSILISARDEFSNVFNRASLTLAGFQKSALAIAAVGTAVAAGMYKAVNAAAEVETGFAKVNTLLDAGQNAEELFGNFVEETNIQLGNQGDEISVLSGLYQTISAGITDAADAQTFLAQATKASVGGSAELPTVILAGTKALAAYGLGIDQTQRVFDAFAGTVKAGQTTMEELAAAFPEVAGMAGQAGISLEETLGTFAGLTKVLSNSDETATSLSQTIRGFIKPSEDMATAVSDLGYQSATAMVEQVGLNEALKQLNEYVDGDTEAMAKLFPNVRALKAVFPLLGLAANDVTKSIDIVSKSTGLSQKQFEDMTNTLEYKWGQAMSEAENLLVSIGDIIKDFVMPIVEKLVEWIRIVVDWWNGLSEIQKKVIIVFTAVTAAAALLAGAIALLTYVSSPWLLIISGIVLAVGVLAAGIYYLWEKSELFRNGVELLWELLKFSLLPVIILVQAGIAWLKLTIEAVEKIIDYWMPQIQKVIDFIKMWVDAIKDLVGWINKITFGIFGESSKDIDKTTKSINKLAEATGSDNVIMLGGSSSNSSDVIKLGGSNSNVIKLNDFILSNGKIIQPSPQDTIIGTKGGVGNTFVFNIDKIQGVDAKDMMIAFQEELSNKITLG